MAIRPTTQSASAPSRTSSRPPSRETEKDAKTEDKDDKKEAKKSPEEDLQEKKQAAEAMAKNQPGVKILQSFQQRLAKTFSNDDASGPSLLGGGGSTGSGSGIPGGLGGALS
jgi:hypothetical protein